MSFELNKEGSRVIYLNFRSLGDGKKETEAEQIFTFSHLIEDSSKWLVSIERMRLPIQSIPMQDSINNAFILRSKTGGDDIFISTIVSFGLYDWLLQINRASASLDIVLTADGRAQILDFDFDSFSIEIDQKVSAILDIPITVDGAGIQSVIGGVPIFDLFDQLFKIQDKIDIWMDTKEFFTHRLKKDINEGNYQKSVDVSEHIDKVFFP